MKQLIVNADDYNTDGERNRGILEAARYGIVTSTSVLANTGWPDGARENLLAVFGRRIGVHLNLTKGRPLAAAAQSLTQPDGTFYAKPAAWRRGLRGGFDTREAQQEFVTQIEALLASGCAPDHVDGNNHMHVFPGLARAAAAAAASCGLRRIRLPREPLWWSVRWPGRAFVKKCFICLLSLQAENVFRKAGLCFPDRCAGLQVPDTSSAAELEKFLALLPHGTTELMCHPGYAGTGSTFSTKDRERERAALTDPRVRAAIKQMDITLISYGDLSCA